MIFLPFDTFIANLKNSKIQDGRNITSLQGKLFPDVTAQYCTVEKKHYHKDTRLDFYRNSTKVITNMFPCPLKNMKLERRAATESWCHYSLDKVDIEKAIQVANIGVNPNNDGDFIKLFFPPMTVEQRGESAKQAKGMTDNAKVAIRNIRKNANGDVKKLHKDKEISDDENKKSQDEIQKITDSYVTKADAIFKAKEAEILKV